MLGTSCVTYKSHYVQVTLHFARHILLAVNFAFTYAYPGSVLEHRFCTYEINALGCVVLKRMVKKQVHLQHYICTSSHHVTILVPKHNHDHFTMFIMCYKVHYIFKKATVPVACTVLIIYVVLFWESLAIPAFQYEDMV